jgi:UDP-perosamine 4-acetyltransferase
VKVVIYGSRPDGHAKVVSDLAADADFEVIGLIDDFPENAGRSVRGVGVSGTSSNLEALRREGSAEGVLIGFGESKGRAELVRRVAAAGYELPRLVHRSAHVRGSAELGPGVQVLALAYVGPDARIGAGVLINTAAVVEHDCAIADGAVVGPSVTLCGRVRIESDATIGAGATVLPDVKVGVSATVGAGALVRDDVADESLVAGIPARPIGRPG